MRDFWISGVIVLLPFCLAGFNFYKYQACKTEFAEYRAKVAKDAAQASANTVKIVQTLTRRYETALSQRNEEHKKVEAAYKEALNLIHTKGKNDAVYRDWAARPLPPVVVKRLRELPETRSED